MENITTLFVDLFRLWGLYDTFKFLLIMEGAYFACIMIKGMLRR